MGFVKTILFIIFFVQVIYAQSFEQSVFENYSEQISGKQLIDYIISRSPIKLGKCTVSEIRRNRDGISFVFKRGWKNKRYSLPINDNDKVKIVHSYGEVLIFYYDLPDSLFLQIDEQKNITKFGHYYRNSLFERIFVKKDNRYNECGMEERPEAVSQLSRNSRKKTSSQVQQRTSGVQMN